MKDTSYLVDDDIAFGEMMRQNSMIAEAESSELAFDTGGDRKLQRFNWCPNSCNPLNGRRGQDLGPYVDYRLWCVYWDVCLAYM